ncbi:MerR family transcriptional regulator (plasmid) [Clostridium tyrobutyricum]|uniref:MerR family transcriptional regulator n=1 Tax=Clostridium tyrobutyricum TaxID=1519 RepID=UPI0039F6A8EE
MDYTINKLAKLAGVSSRTLRYYEEIDLLSPSRMSTNGYRIYTQQEIDRLQQILFYRELGVSLEKIKNILLSEDFDRKKTLKSHLSVLLERRKQLNLLIDNVKKTMKFMEGKIVMSNQEKFKGFLKKMVDDNECEYGDEIRKKYGNASVDFFNKKILDMSKERYIELEKLTDELNITLKAAFEQGDPSSELAKKACELHKKWLCFYWNNCTKEAHIGLTQMYVDDPRFTAYYDKIEVGCAKFLRDAVYVYYK